MAEHCVWHAVVFYDVLLRGCARYRYPPVSCGIFAFPLTRVFVLLNELHLLLCLEQELACVALHSIVIHSCPGAAAAASAAGPLKQLLKNDHKRYGGREGRHLAGLCSTYDTIYEAHTIFMCHI